MNVDNQHPHSPLPPLLPPSRSTHAAWAWFESPIQASEFKRRVEAERFESAAVAQRGQVAHGGGVELQGGKVRAVRQRAHAGNVAARGEVEHLQKRAVGKWTEVGDGR
eukprot:CAMPEP_0171605534 /NCGR_PEP_ID=MMETSP0990-20121206/7246_1 /TAXON_ID=483369 /ORGANISM="non described non described, Strain CCMP2098" /LENGTH=107 /DNA_ID=CAMNT_0012168241 /DNA_START=454 /DNA_END=778 /DNA_ORIENTATION=+